MARFASYKTAFPNARLTRAAPLTSRSTRIALMQKLRRIIDEGTGYGLAPEGISAAEIARSMAAKR